MTDPKSRRSVLLRENSKILQRFSSDGVDLTKEREVTFTLTLPDNASCKTVREKFLFKNKSKFGGLFLTANYEGYCELEYSVKMKVSAELISEIEEVLEIAVQDGGFDLDKADISWIFQD